MSLLKDFKKCWVIGLGLMIESMLIMVQWVLLGLLFKQEYEVGFGYFYGFQFLLSLGSGVVSGACISAGLDKNSNQQYTGAIVAILIEFILFIIISINIDSILQFLCVPLSWHAIFKFYIAYSSITAIMNILICPLAYNNKETVQTGLRIGYYILVNLVLLVVGYCSQEEGVTYLVTLLIAALYTAICTVTTLKLQKLTFNIKQWIKISTKHFVRNICFTMIYFWDTHRLASIAYEYLLASTLISYASDIQWDTSYAYETVVNVALANGTYDYKHLHKVSLLFLTILDLSVIPTCLIWYFNGYSGSDIPLLCFGVGIQLINIYITPFYGVRHCELNVRASGKIVLIVAFVPIFIRTCITMIPSVYATFIAQLAAGMVKFIMVNAFIKKVSFLPKC